MAGYWPSSFFCMTETVDFQADLREIYLMWKWRGV